MLSIELQRSAANELTTMQDCLRFAVSRLNQSAVYFGHGSDNAIDEALQLLTFSLGLPLKLDEHWLSASLLKTEREAFLTLLAARINEHIPVAYLTQEAWFYGLPFYVDERVLIPRSPIAELLEERFKTWWPEEKSPQRILDLCCGSGCIGIAAAVEYPQAEVELFDISFDALEVAQLNIERHELEDRVQAYHSDLLSAASGQYDLILSNPPYVDAQDMADLPAEYLHEPELALAAGEDGLDLAHTILAQAGKHLTAEGLLVVEVGNSWPALAAAYPQLPFHWVEFKRGGHGVFVLRAQDLALLK